MSDKLETGSFQLIKKLDTSISSIATVPEQNPMYWFLTVKNIGKMNQTLDMVKNAVENFSVEDHTYTILKYIASKFIAYELCLTAVSKNGRNLSFVPNEYRDLEMCLAAVRNDGIALGSVPKELKNYDLCKLAVNNDLKGKALSFVPVEILQDSKSKELIELAIENNGLSIAYVSKRQITAKMAKKAILHTIAGEERLSPIGCKFFYPYRDFPIGYIPKRFMTEELILLSCKLLPESLSCVPTEYLTKDLCLKLIEQDSLNLKYIPIEIIDKQLVDKALKANPKALEFVPLERKTKKRCFDAKKRDSSIPLSWFPDDIREEWEEKIIININAPVAPSFPKRVLENTLLVKNSKLPVIHYLQASEETIQPIYYISDIHIEHQLAAQSVSLFQVKQFIKEKVAELIASVPEASGILLVGGDVADGIGLEYLFYSELHRAWEGEIIAVLGNHELWNGNSTGQFVAQPVDEIIEKYKKYLTSRVTLVENTLLVSYKGFPRLLQLTEAALLESSIDDLTEVCKNSTFLLLGGIGFSGLNQQHNASTGLYRSSVTREEDIARSQRFNVLYNKLLSCAKDLPVIIFTHTQMADWSSADYNPNWIYVNGHTHQNSIILKEDGTTVLSDNQVGYKPQAWHLNGFTILKNFYDPFSSLPDGIHQITRKQYLDFNRGRGIATRGSKFPGTLYALKRDNYYMFILQSNMKNYLLAGGILHTLQRDIPYYFQNLPLYAQSVKNALAPYRTEQDRISKEVKSFGGEGSIHGCIVDIDFCHHIYLNPFDGKITPYFAWDIRNKIIFSDVEALLKKSPKPPSLPDGTPMLKRYQQLVKRQQFTALAPTGGDNRQSVCVPEIVLDTSMYSPSRIMRSFQYIFDQNVLRTWKDEILTFGTNQLKNGDFQLPPSYIEKF